MSYKNEIRRVIFQEIISLVKSGKIKNVKIDNIDYDIRNDISLEWYNKQILISRKYIKHLEQFKIEDIQQFLVNDTYDLSILNSNNKYISFNVTQHASIQFIKRFIFLYLDKNHKLDFSNKLNSVFEKYFDLFLKYNKNKQSLNREVVIEAMKEILFDSSYFDADKTGRLRDKVAFTNRSNENTNRYFCHPFLFVVQDNMLKTVELYSSSVDMRTFNAITSNNKKFNNWLKNFFI